MMELRGYLSGTRIGGAVELAFTPGSLGLATHALPRVAASWDGVAAGIPGPHGAPKRVQSSKEGSQWLPYKRSWGT